MSANYLPERVGSFLPERVGSFVRECGTFLRKEPSGGRRASAPGIGPSALIHRKETNVPRKRYPTLQRAPQNDPIRHLPGPVDSVPPLTQSWLQATGQAVPDAPNGAEALERFCAPGAGRYSVNRAENGTAYHKWSFKTGKWRGHYVMYVADHKVPLLRGIELLEDKIAEVHAGKLKPARDPYFKG